MPATLNVATKTTWSLAVPAYWDKTIMPEADRESIIARLAASDGTDAVINEREDLSKQPGDTIYFTTLQRLIGAGVSGATSLEGVEEVMVNGRYTVTVDMTRHATAANEIARVESLIDFPVWARKQIGGWLARFLDDQALNEWLNVSTIATIYAGGKTARASLAPGDLLLPHELRRLQMRAQRRGAKPFRTLKDMRLPFPVYAALMSEVDYYNLVNDANFRQDVRLAALRTDPSGSGNPALDGTIDMYQGSVIFRWSTVNPGDSFLGSYLRPEAVVGGSASLTSTGTTLTTGPATAVANVNYNKYFPTTGTNTLLIDSEQMTYSAAPGNSTITVVRAAGGTSGATHTVGTLVTLNNVGKVLALGANSLMRAWAMRPTKIDQDRDYGFELGIGIKFINGVKAVVNGSDATESNAVVMEVYSANPNTA